MHPTSLYSLLAVGCGSFVGGCLRYGLTLLLPAPRGAWPVATLMANVLGCLLLGGFTAWLAHHTGRELLRLFLTVGLCGGFTTFSTLTREGVALWQEGLSLSAIIYVGATLVLGFAALFLGFWWGGKG